MVRHFLCLEEWKERTAMTPQILSGHPEAPECFGTDQCPSATKQTQDKGRMGKNVQCNEFFINLQTDILNSLQVHPRMSCKYHFLYLPQSSKASETLLEKNCSYRRNIMENQIRRIAMGAKNSVVLSLYSGGLVTQVKASGRWISVNSWASSAQREAMIFQ